MSAKHFINDPTHLVTTALRSLTYTNPSVALDEENKIIYRRPDKHGHQVALISGGGSGHEPSFSAFVGPGLLSAAITGTIFASPSAEQVRRAIQGRVDPKRGVLVIVMNYTGDVLNFGMAVEKAKASGLNVEMVVVGDDVGVGRKKAGKVGRRGIAGTVLVQKVAGALAATGAPLDVVFKAAQLTSKNLASVGASLSHVHVPGREQPDPNSEENLDLEEIEIGMGIHNEPGFARVKMELPELVKTMLSQLLDTEDNDRAFLHLSPKDEVVLLINNLGGVSPLELSGVTAEVVEQLRDHYKVDPVRIFSGTYMTSLSGQGFSITILKVADLGLGSGKSMVELLEAPSEATGWTRGVSAEVWDRRSDAVKEEDAALQEETKPSNLTVDPAKMKKVLTSGLESLIEAEPDVTKYDTIVGDGDCGIGLKRGAESILALLEKTKLSEDALLNISSIISVIELSMDGTSGALYAIFLNALAHGLRVQSPPSPKPATPEVWARALQISLESLGQYTPAKPGDRTLIDALEPFVNTLSETNDPKKAAEAARKGSEGTKGMKASLGRTVYVGGEGWQGVPDPGAHGLSVFLSGIAEAM
ncbi:MAG: hypothetical protein M1819_000320 [Sarea resinae]|nr:MAG: hypothetical protein M1819_000320 [Sarea resinae]